MPLGSQWCCRPPQCVGFQTANRGKGCKHQTDAVLPVSGPPVSGNIILQEHDCGHARAAPSLLVNTKSAA